MGTAYIDITIQPKERGVLLFQAECAAEIEYTAEDGDLIEWHVTNLKFTDTGSVWDDTAGKWTRGITRTTMASKAVKELLTEYIDTRELEERLFEHLRSNGELGYFNEALRADYRAVVR